MERNVINVFFAGAMFGASGIELLNNTPWAFPLSLVFGLFCAGMYKWGGR